MARDPKPDKHAQKRKSSPATLRRQQVLSKSMAGEKTQAIADSLGISRGTVSRILNSDEVKAIVKTIDARLAAGIDDAILTVLDEVKMDYKAARDLLKNYGSMKESIDLVHAYPEPMVVELRDGKTRIKLGVKDE